MDDRDGDVGRRWLVAREYHSAAIRSWAIALVVGVGVMTAGTFVLTDALGEERPSLEPLGTAAAVVLGGVLLFWVWRRVTVGNAYVALGPDSLVVRAGVTVDVRVPYDNMMEVNYPPLSPLYWKGPVGFHLASQALRVGPGGGYVEVVLKAPHTGGGLRFPSPPFSRLWLGVRDAPSLFEALERTIGPPGDA